MGKEYKFDFCIASFSALEKQLASCMEYIPFIDTNKQVLSPKFVPIISRSRTGLNMAYLFPAKETSNHAQAQLQA